MIPSRKQMLSNFLCSRLSFSFLVCVFCNGSSLLLCSGQRELCTPLVRGRREFEFDGESWEAKYFFTVDFLANPLKLCAVNSSNTWVLIFFIFVEFLSSSLLSARRIQNIGIRSHPQMRNAWLHIAGVLVVYWKLIAMSVSRKVHNTNSQHE
jgi:hypothetical protein